MPVAGIVLAAGPARRFGSAKQLAPLAGRPLLEHALLAMASARSVDSALVVLGAHASEIVQGVELHGLRPVVCADWALGLASSLRAGIAALSAEAEAAVVTLGDQPTIAPAAIDRLVAARSAAYGALRATYAGRPGHPVVIERRLFASLAQLRGDRGARDLLDAEGTKPVACDGLGCDVDVDTPAQLARARERADSTREGL
jgi:molybdenum cofactor cytidylyltransferase